MSLLHTLAAFVLALGVLVTALVAGLATVTWATRKKPSPWIITSSGLPVDCEAPPVIRLSIEPSVTPRPTWAAFAPPAPPPGPEAPRCSWVSESLNVVRADL